ncbi:pseudouridine-5-phosphate glycosidase [Pelagivirga sediminicola]|uniref:Pseudouridine-5'-phosphate glycosidase n=1 Tax=Pelagivirga sediminicola TaxID=2170575 RepID=A0A2T7GAY9_9RHOB|nr:pseudouridine-5'-phosphate glycosidase [Pelagivirga sediminicola]PVA11573.1 pseudouridine-5-phosphate glycosidase [Pelagivirga sediminicola]
MHEMIWSDEAARARDAGAPLVALESTIITHGMPCPENLATARAVEGEVRGAGAVPATIAVLDGRLHIGLDAAQLERLARLPGPMKLSRADLAVALATGASGGTTVAATMIAAARARIAVFATGGIGGVHLGAERSWDVSADLQELAQSRVTVVCAGPKAILDLPKTLELLETLGVPVIAYGQDALPAFWSPASPHAAPLRLDSADAIAAAHLARAALGLPGGQLICNPVPAGDGIPYDDLAPLIAQAAAETETAGIAAKQVTPHLLRRLGAATGGRTLTANIALVRSNARLAAAIARALQTVPGPCK